MRARPRRRRTRPLLAIGSSLATLAPAARAWHDLRGATLSKKRGAKSLADWRGAGPDARV